MAMPPLIRLLRVGLLARFALASLVAVVLLGVVLAHTLAGQIRQRALANARQSAQLIDQSLVQPQLSAADLAAGLSQRHIRGLDRALQASLAGKEIARIKVWNRQNRVVYASDHVIIGHTFPASEELRAALGGNTASEVSDLRKAENANDRSFGQLLEVYTPLRFGGSSQPAGAFELYLPYRPIAAVIAHDTLQLYLFLAGGLALLYLTLFRIVAGASTRLRRQAAENAHLAMHDPLTDLPNRSLFHDRAQQAILAARRDGTRVALMILDLDRFKEVNDTLGHHNGDLLLQEIGARLGSELRDGDSVARLGGDEFGLLLPTFAEPSDALVVGEKVREALRQAFALQGVTLDLEASVGIALYPEHGQDVDMLLQRADVAMYVAKEDHTGCELYSAERDEYSPGRLALAAELRRALDERELVLHYQPIAELAHGQIVGVEALVRWQHPERGLLGPDEFVPLAERTGLIRELTLYVLAEALRQVRIWHEEGLDLIVAVNLSARDLLDFTLPEAVGRLLTANRVPATRLGLEITESVILADPMRARAILTRLSEMGVRLAIDDYGSGYSSLGYLKRLPVSEIKIDRSFVMNMEQDENDAVIVRSTVELGRNLGLRVVAEGVQAASAWALLKALNCDYAQGYYLSRPIVASGVPTFIRRAVEHPSPAAPHQALAEGALG
jgi:diguanylate cyclase (GGDEF)-like protein